MERAGLNMCTNLCYQSHLASIPRQELT